MDAEEVAPGLRPQASAPPRSELAGDTPGESCDCGPSHHAPNCLASSGGSHTVTGCSNRYRVSRVLARCPVRP